MKEINRLTMVAIVVVLVGAVTGCAQSVDRGLERLRDIYKELVETNTTLSTGDCTLAAKRMGERPHSSLGYRTPNEFAAVLKSSVMTG
jgi:hypothetical protein